MTKSIPKLATVGEIAVQFNVPIHRIEYILRSREHIHVRAVAGAARCFDETAIAQIRHELNKIGTRQQEVSLD